MSLPRFDVLVPESVEETCRLLALNLETGAGILAGGTDLLVDLKQPLVQSNLYTLASAGGDETPALSTHSESDLDELIWAEKERHYPALLVSLHKLDELKQIEVLPDGRVQVGALITAREIQRDVRVRQGWTALAEGADALGSPLVRARGTLGGNICNARPAADMLVPTICLNAELKLQSSAGERTVPAFEFVTGPGQTTIQPGEILTRIVFPAPAAHTASAYYKLAQRKALDISVVGVASGVSLDKAGQVTAARVSMGAVGPKPLLSLSAETTLVGKKPSDELILQAARAAAGDATPIDDHRGSV